MLFFSDEGAPKWKHSRARTIGANLVSEIVLCPCTDVFHYQTRANMIFARKDFLFVHVSGKELHDLYLRKAPLDVIDCMRKMSKTFLCRHLASRCQEFSSLAPAALTDRASFFATCNVYNSIAH